MRIGDFHIVNGQEIVLPPGVNTTPGHAAIVSVTTQCRGAPCIEDRSMIPAIPPRADNWKITGITPFQDDVTLYLAYPHGHLRLADMTYVVSYPDGREETILSVPRFDFNWQIVYEWAQPLRIPGGSTIKAIAHYDNSTRNKGNPGPDDEVFWGEQTSDEMFNGYVDLSIDKMDVRLEHRPAGNSPATPPPIGNSPATPSARGNSPDIPPPKVPIVTVVGCVTRSGGVEMLTRASPPTTSTIVHADAQEIADARETPLGSNRYRLIGTAEFGSIDNLLATDQRALFTRAATANVTNSLRDGPKLTIKGLLIAGVPEPVLNVLSVQPVAGACR
jgi:hypothetical protein